jgi:hypothetical protein
METFPLGLYGGEDLDVIFNTVIFISKWEIWKIRNKVKYNQSRIGDQKIFNTWKNNFKKHIVSSLSLIWQGWHLPFDKIIFFNLCSV